MSTYTCNTCELQFKVSEAQREHMKSDWHRYNLKRRVAHLSPISQELFDSKVQAVSDQKAESQGSDSKKQLTKKELRRREKEALLEKKRQLLKMAEQSMLKKMQEQKLEVPDEALEAEKVAAEEPTSRESEREESVAEEGLTEEQLAEKLMQQKIDNRVDIPLTECFFCSKGKSFETVELNLEHMFKNHGFYIPEQKYLVDRDGLLEYMTEKIGLGNVCIVCNFQGRSLEAVRAHMLAKRHCKIPYEEEDEKLEVSQFYDFSSTYQQQLVDRETNEEDWEDVESGEEDASSDEEVPVDNIYHDGVELHLPTGIKVGHRSLQRYYRQNLRPEIELTEGQGTLVAAETRSFLTPFDRKKVQVQQRTWQTELKDKKRHDKRAAKFINNQPHYRDQLLQ